MRRLGWIGIGLIVTVAVVGLVIVVPVASLGLPSALSVSAAAGSSDSPQPKWNSGNLCNAVFNVPNPGDVQCVSKISDSKVPLWYNFSAGKVKGGVVNVTIIGSHDCIFMNFHSFDTTLNITVLGSGYTCAYFSNGTISGSPSSSAALGGDAEWAGGQGCSGGGGGGWLSPDWGHGGGTSCCSKGYGSGGSWISPDWGHGSGANVTCGPGINIAINSENDVLNLVQGSVSHCERGRGGYATNVTIYATTVVANVVQNQDHLNTTITYIGSSAGFATCPYKYENGRVHWTEVANGNKDTFNTIFVNQAGAKHAPPNSPYSTEPLGPPDGTAVGYNDVYGNETTTTAPPGTCQYIGV